MDKFNKNNKRGITLIALVVMVIVLIILASVGTTTGLHVAREARYYNSVSSLKTMQTKVNEMYEEFKSGNTQILSDGQDIETSGVQSKAQTAYNTVKENNLTNKDIGNISDYKYYSAEDIKSKLDIDGIDSDVLINVKTRTVLLLDGIKRDGKTYYSLNEIENEQYNVDYIDPSIKIHPNGGTYYIPKKQSLEIQPTLTLLNKPESVNVRLEYVWSKLESTAPSSGWTEFSNGDEISKINVSTAGNYYIWTRITNTESNEVLYVEPSNKFVIKDTPLHTDVKYAVNHWQQNVDGNKDIQNSTNYTLKDTENLEGVEDEEITPEAKAYEGFTAPELQTVTIAKDGSTVLDYYYTRNKYTLTVRDIDGISVEGSLPGEHYYGETITLTATAANGYSFTGWASSDETLVPNSSESEITFTMPADNITLIPVKVANSYTVTLTPGSEGTLPNKNKGETETKQVTYYSTYGTLPTPTRDGYTFAGWFTQADRRNTSNR